jgi:hypothetical protein
MEAQSQQTLVVYKNTKRNNYGSYELKDFKGKGTNNQESRGQTKDLSRKRHLSGLYNRISGLKKELI